MKLSMTVSKRIAVIAAKAAPALAILLVGCGGGATTEQLPPAGGNPGGGNYTGPPPATNDIQAFMVELWENIRPGQNRCGECHSDDGGQSPMFARDDDVNLAYAEANALVELGNPVNSRLVTKVGGGHNCWLGTDQASNQACADIMTTWIENWAGGTGSSAGRQIQLTAPEIHEVGDSRNFPVTAAGPPDFGAAGGLHELLTTYCAGCHASSANSPQTPYFADADVDAAYEAVKSKINLDDPAESRLVVRLRFEFHNCWGGDCVTSSQEMEDRIAAYAGQIQLTQVDQTLVLSKAMNLYNDGIVASGGNRYEANQIALWEFKAGQGSIARDTSGVDPALDLTLRDEVDWVGGWGIDIRNGRAQGSTTASKKLHDLIKATSEYSIEAWVAPGNVNQEDTNIVSYSAGNTARNFTLGQTLYSYDYYNRSSNSDGNGDPFMQTAAADEDLQATLQHVVTNYDPVNGRRIYVNGQFTDDMDPIAGGTLADWDDTFAFVLGSETSGDRQWVGVIRMAAIHNRVLTPEQIQQNMDVGVGEKFFLLFYVGDLIPSVPESYIMFEVSQFDSYSYLFNRPMFISLDPNADPGNIPLRGMRIGINGVEAPVGQAYRTLDTALTSAAYDPATGQVLSDLGTVIGLEKGPDSDIFFLTFEEFGNNSRAYTEPTGLTPADVDSPRQSAVGLRTFDEINFTMSAVTGVPTTDNGVVQTYDGIKQSLPTVESIETFAPAHETAIAQLAIAYCDALVDGPNRDTYFDDLSIPGAFNFNAIPSVAFAGNNRDEVLNPLVDNIMGVGLIDSQPDFADVVDEIGYATAGGTPPRPDNLIDRLIATDDSDAQRTQNITKAVCAAVLGSGVTLVQ